MITIRDNSLVVKTPYNAGFVASLKEEIPPSARKWDSQSKVWVVSPQYGDILVKLIYTYYQRQVILPIIHTSQIEISQFKLEYLGTPKDRGDGKPIAFGWADEGWNLIFSLDILTQWFDPSGTSRPGESASFYAMLGVSQKANNEAIKKAYRQAAKTWHPDVCREPDAKEQFQAIQRAYEVLSDDRMRRKYDAGLSLSAKSGMVGQNVWRPPVRCGMVLAEGQYEVGRFVVNDILAWEEILDSLGRVMVSYWQDDTFKTEWISNEFG